MSRQSNSPNRRAAKGTAQAISCPECGEPLRITRQPHRYSLTPKWAITIEDAEIRRCGKCGYFEVVVPRPEALHRTVAAEIIRKPTRLSGAEMVFLRTQLGMTARGLAKAMGVVPESMSRWENDVLPVPPPIDRLVRTMVALTTEGDKFSVETLSGIAGAAGPMKLVVTVDPKGAWKRAA